MNNRHRKTLIAIFTNPVPKNLVWSSVEALFINIGCKIIEGDGSRVGFEFGRHRADFHRPHPGKEAKPYQIKAARDFLKLLEVKP